MEEEKEEEVVWPCRCVLATIPQATGFCSRIPTLVVEHNDTAGMQLFSTFVCVFGDTAASLLLETSPLCEGDVISLKSTA